MNLKAKIAVFLLFLGLLFLPMIQQHSTVFKVHPLTAQADPAAFPKFTIKTWFSGEFQEQFNTATEENIGFRPGLIRFKNQIDYSLFKRANASGVIVGRDNNLFEADYIRSFTGRDYLGDSYWEEKFKRLGKVADTLGKLGTRIAIVLEPGKGTYDQEFIPARYKRHAREKTNYSAIKKLAEQNGIPLLDVNQLFRDKKPSTALPLFPKGGIHWSVGGMVIASDALLAFIDRELGIPVPDLVIDRVEFSDSLRDTDNDLVAIMNLACKPHHPQMGYPVYHFESPDTLIKPRVLVISDSFFFNILNAGIPARTFANEAFWYYNKTIYPDSWSAPTDTVSINIREAVESMDLVLIMVTERFYHRFDWDFTDALFTRYYQGEAKEYRYDLMRSIIRDFNWFDLVQKESDYSSIPMKDKLIGHTDYLFWEADQAGRIPHNSDYNRRLIMKDSAWMKQIREKALINGLTEEQQLRMDAEWMVNHPDQ
jgi:hypothetical protein